MKPYLPKSDSVAVCLISATIAFACPPALAQVPESDRKAVASELRVVSENLVADDLPDLAIAKQDVLRSYDALNRYLSEQASPENQAAWLQYIEIDSLIEAIESGNEERRDLALMGREALDVGQRLVGIAPGLERQPLLELRQALDQLVDALRFHDERSLSGIAEQLTRLADRIESIDGVPTPDDEAAINATISIMQDSGQSPDMVRRIRRLFGRPNIAVWVSEGAVRQALRRPVDQQTPVRDCILGTRLVGKARLTGVVTADLLPSIGTVRVRVEMDACVKSNNTGYNGPVVLRTSSTGQVHAARELTFDESGIRMQPTTATVALNSNVDEIQHPLRLVRRIARRKAAEQKPRSDVIAKRKFHDRIGEEFTKETDATADVPVPDIMGQVRPVLHRLDLAEPTRDWGSTDTALYVHSTFRREDQISAPLSAPPILAAFDAAVQVHESVVNNAVAPILAGRTFNESKMNELITQAGGTIPIKSTDDADADDAESEEPPFEIDFSRVRPVIFEARDQRIRIGIRGTRFAQGRRELKRPMEITAVYAPAKTEEGRMILVREGDVDVDFPGGRRLTVAQAGLKGTITNKFADVFPSILLDQPLTVPDTVQLDAIRGRVYHPCLIAADDGWLSLAVR